MERVVHYKEIRIGHLVYGIWILLGGVLYNLGSTYVAFHDRHRSRYIDSDSRRHNSGKTVIASISEPLHVDWRPPESTQNLVEMTEASDAGSSSLTSM